LSEEKYESKVNIIHGDCEHLTRQIPNKSFDLVIDIESSFYYPDKLAFLKEVFNVMKDDATFIFAFYTHETKLAEIYDYINRYFFVEKSEDITENAIKSLKLDRESVVNFCDNHYPWCKPYCPIVV
jgi:SAM-dependent methyltransferase